jgi:glutamate synthase (NADPH) small chain
MTRRTLRTIPQDRTVMATQGATERIANFGEVALGYGAVEARREADRCILCPQKPCSTGCPVGIDIPRFIERISAEDYRGAYEVLSEATLLPAICGRVCPQESQCEAVCVVGDHLEPVGIGRLERFVGDMAIAEGWAAAPPEVEATGLRVAIVGAGPAGIACAADLAKAGCEVTVYEALHRPGGVLSYGIPGFRLPRHVVESEFAKVIGLGVKIECNTLVGRLFTVDQMRDEMGFDAVFIGTGAGAPRFMGIRGESLNDVLSANEFLTRANLMQAGQFPRTDTPLKLGSRVAVVGAGNTAMDAMRTALRLGAEEVHCLYRRSRSECPARLEELEHAEEEGVIFHWLTAPTEILGQADGSVRAVRCTRMELGEPDPSGRARAVPLRGSEHELEADMVIFAIGTRANPILAQTSQLASNADGYLVADQDGRTSLAGIFAGGDIVSGAATVIQAMGAGRRAARSIKAYLGILEPRQRDVSDASLPRIFGIVEQEMNFRRIRVA